MRPRTRTQRQFVTVLETTNETSIALAQSILNDAGIRYFVKNRSVQALQGWGHFGAGYNVAFGPAQIQVSSLDADTAYHLIGELPKSAPPMSRKQRKLLFILMLIVWGIPTAIQLFFSLLNLVRRYL